MQIFKELGLYDVMQEESLKYYEEKTCIVVIESLAGKLLHYYMDDVNEVRADSSRFEVLLPSSSSGD